MIIVMIIWGLIGILVFTNPYINNLPIRGRAGVGLTIYFVSCILYISGIARNKMDFYFWKFIHNAIIHPLMSGPWREPKWLNFLHDWTAKRCQGAG